MKELHAAIQRVIADVEQVLTVIDATDAPLRANHRQTFEMQLRSLRLVDGELHEQVVTRRVWSLGTATVPVLRSMLNAAGKPRMGLPDGLVEGAQQSLVSLRTELTRFAEGR